jgi:hypothetical protein
MKKIRFTTVLLALAGLACNEGPEAPETFRERDDEDVTASTLIDVCSPAEQIVRLSPTQGTCPTATNWTEHVLFSDGTGDLAKYCKYIWSGGGMPDQAAVAILANKPGILSIAGDCESVYPQTGDALWTTLGADVEKLFHHAIGRPDAADLDLANTEDDRSHVIVAVIDTVPFAEPTTPTSEHGTIMAGIIRDIACPDPQATCAVEVKHALGLPNIELGVEDPVNGGFFGGQSDVSDAIHNAVDLWWSTYEHLDEENRPKLIISLSLGWSPAWFGDLEGQYTRPAVSAVYDALRYASCFGVTTIVAAGNDGQPCQTGPLLPGGWEEHAAPNAAACTTLGAPYLAGGSGYRPLVYSVGGVTPVNGQFAPMPGTRPEGMPRLAAMARGNAIGDSTTLMGTSVSAAVVAGAAALAWSYNPDLEPGELMAGIYQSGSTVYENGNARTADYIVPGTPSTTVRAVNACAALSTICGQTGTCPFTGPLPCLNEPPPLTLTDLFDAAEDSNNQGPPPVPSYPMQDGSCVEYECNGEAPGLGLSNTTACPVPIPSAHIFTYPQPTQVACPNCMLDTSIGVVYASLDPSYVGWSVADLMITVYDQNNDPAYFRFGAYPSLGTTSVSEIRLANSLPPLSRATITMVLTDSAAPPMVVVDELLIQ